ncbi:unnamed protein product [Rotaria socialis]|uniref:Cadherin domain-containing protein n=7 Tax=Rotaria socialis TaxID=392032 RepID=A0A821ISM3_9BILA|nr:unnamed protein product [Rotaria socialis]CAF4705654.1 unnamed protein product [Rotaria socialis]
MQIIQFLLLFLLYLKPIYTAIQRLTPISLNEQSSIGTSIYDLSRVYSSSSNLYKFSFLSDSSPHNSFFIIDSLTGRISIKRMIDREELCQTHICNCERCILTLEIIASSQSIDILSLDITIININDNQPLFPISIFHIRLSENTDIGYISSFPSAADLDFQDRLEYRILAFNESSDQDLFETFSLVNLHTENQLGLRLLKSLDREKRTIYKMRISASDGELTGQLLLDVHILDSNDNVPKFEHEQYYLKLYENTPMSTDILHIHAYDNDEGLNALINYTIITNHPLETFPFEINATTGIIKLIHLLDYEQETTYRFNVRARDNGPDAINVYTQIQVDILDVNDCPPDIDFILPDIDPNKIDPRKYMFYIDEEQNINTRLFHLSVNDKDSMNDKIELKLLTYTNLFQLNEQYNDLYSLSVIGRLDREQQEQYRLTFEARDQGARPSLITQKDITIVLLDINDSPPLLDRYPSPININENNPPNIKLVQFHAQDFDAPNSSNSLLTYSLISSNNSRLFHIDPLTGIFSVGKNISFDYESQSKYNLILNISDHGKNPKHLETLHSFVVYINDINDNKPKFQQDSYSFRVQENIPIGTLIGQITASDLDTNTTIHYELTCIDDQDVFEINLLNGQLRTKAILDYENHPLHRLYVTAKDNDYLHSDRVTVVIELIDINDNTPIIEPLSAIYIPSELLETSQSKSITITNINAHDRDSGMNGNLTYTIIDGNQNDYFQINSLNGTIYAQSNSLRQGHHRLTVKVCDQNELIPKCSTIDINIKVGEYINKLFYTASINSQPLIDKIQGKEHTLDYETILTREIIIVVIVSTILTLVFSITMGILIAVFCKQKRCKHLNRSSLTKPCELLQSTDADKLLTTTATIQSNKLNGHHHLEPYDDIKRLAGGGGGGGSSEDSCYGSNDLSRSSSSAHGVARPLLTAQHRSSSLSSTSVDYAVPTQRHQSSTNNKSATMVVVGIHQSISNVVDDNNIQQQCHPLKTFHSPATSSSLSNHYNLKKTVQAFTRRPVADLQSTYLTYDSIDVPPPPPPANSNMLYPNHSSAACSSTGSSTSREYSI